MKIVIFMLNNVHLSHSKLITAVVLLVFIFAGVDGNIEHHFRRHEAARNEAAVLHEYIGNWLVSAIHKYITNILIYTFICCV